MHIVWFKRDLRLYDHEALARAAAQGPVLCLYILEPDLWRQPDMSGRQYEFLCESLAELAAALRDRGHELVIRVGAAVDILSRLHDEQGITSLWSHQETWNGWTYDRDKQVLAWCRTEGIPWHEIMQHGVVRRLQDRDGWAAAWQRQMRIAPIPVPTDFCSISSDSQIMPDAAQIGLADDPCPGRQSGGREAGLSLLTSFFEQRGQHYTKAMSAPAAAWDACSRLSPHLAFGTLSVREVHHQTEYYRQALAGQGRWPSAIRSLAARLRWHCHFIQKLEDEPAIEYHSMHPYYDDLRQDDADPALLAAWKNGQTGYPMVDACMRALNATGWLNFRMRALLASFASYHLWLPWRDTALHLARQFTDYEPGIHYSQIQMQSGMTGINAIRIYNPIKQGLDHDPKGAFIRQWIPELTDMDLAGIHHPWKIPEQMNGYPLPVVDEQIARKAAASRIYAMRKSAGHRDISQDIVTRHGSRKSSRHSVRQRRKKAIRTDNRQTELPL